MSKYNRKTKYISHSIEELSYKGEEWVDIVGYEGLYKISNLGRVLSCEREFVGKNNNRCNIPNKIKSQVVVKTGYVFVRLYKHDKVKSCSVHRLVAKAFIHNNDPLVNDCVNHKDENKLNNDASNLEWCTRAYNNNYGSRNNRISAAHKGITRSYHGVNSTINGLRSTVRIGAFNDDGVLVEAYKNRLDVRTRFGHDVDYALYRKGKCRGFYWKRISEEDYISFTTKPKDVILSEIQSAIEQRMRSQGNINTTYCICNKCGKSKLLRDFNKSPNGKNGYSLFCKECFNKHRRNKYNAQAFKDGRIEL